MNKSIERALPVLANGAITLIVAWPLAYWLGIITTIDALTLQGGFIAIGAVCFWYALVFITLTAVLRTTAMLTGRQWLGGNLMIDRIGGTLTGTIKGAIAAIRLVLIAPVRIAFDAIWKPLEDRLFALVNGWEIDRDLRAEYRKNFRTQYRSFGAFKRAYHGEDQAPAAQSNLADALSLLGLTKDCTRDQCEAQFKALMKKLHPDVGGTDGIAAKLNEAKTIIMKEKGWS